MATEILLSVLIPTVPERLGFLSHQIVALTKQIGNNKQVEILTLLDNKQRTTGKKRNDLLALAQGKFVAFVDDDDTLTPDYISSLLTTIKENPDADCIVFDVVYHDTATDRRTLCKFGTEYEHCYREDLDQYHRKPNHVMCYSRELAVNTQYPDTSFGEDDSWGRKACQGINKQARIDKALYIYDYIYKNRDWYCTRTTT